KLRISGGIEGVMRDSLQRAFAYLQSRKVELGVAFELETTDLHVEAIDLLSNRVLGEVGLGFFLALYSALKKRSVLPALLVLGDMSIQGNLKPVRSLAEPLQVGMENGARKALVPTENKRHFLEVSADIVEKVDPVLYSDPHTAALKALGTEADRADPRWTHPLACPAGPAADPLYGDARRPTGIGEERRTEGATSSGLAGDPIEG